MKPEYLRHSLAHILASAVKDFYPEVKFGIGPAIENGFYYDFEFPKDSPSQEDLPKIEKRMKELVKKNLSFEGKEVAKKQAEKLFKNQPYKLELIEEFSKEKKKLTTYQTGDFLDLCRGGHVKNTKEIKPDSFKLEKVAGAYWRGSEKNRMLTRIYGLAFETKKELQDCLKMKEEAEKKDHRKLGKELDLFSFSDLVGAGLPLWSPKGTFIRNQLQNHLFEISKKYGMQPVTIPHIAKRRLFEISGHAEKFGDELIEVKSHYDEFVMKPVNCPHHIQIYASRPKSYRDLPVRYMESTMQYRDEKPGEIGGLARVRSITVDDGHIFCTPDQIKDEAIKIAKIIEEFYSSLGMFGKHWVSLSVRDLKTPDAYIGEPADWDKAEKMLEEVSKLLKLNAKRVEGEAAIYGPKLDYMFKDSLGREWQLATIQIDFAMPKRFKIEYVNKKGEKSTPIIIHRAILGSYERFLAILIEHYAGAFPLWLSPEQIWIIPIADRHKKYANSIDKELKTKGFRTSVKDEDDTISKKIRGGEMQKIPYLLVVGDKEMKAKSISVRKRGKGDLGALKLNDFVGKIEKELAKKK